MNETSISRRNFLKTAGIAIGGTVFACSGLTVLGTRRPEAGLIENNCGGTEMTEKILIAYASKCGSTGEVAQSIGMHWCEQGASVVVKPVKSVETLDGYSAVAIGSAIRYGKWLAEATGFVEQYKEMLAQLPVAIFSVHFNNRDSSEESRIAREAYTASVREILHPKAEVFFSGVLDAARLSFLEKLMMKAMKAEQGDCRDWNAIRTWGEETYPMLTV